MTFLQRVFLTILFSLSLQTVWAQPRSEESFVSPLDIPLVLSGTFGELRSGHFHAGIDLKTQGREGLPVHAIADGTVTRIKVSLSGYGKALYVAHPNGKTSVYAHLSRFADPIEAYVKEQQYLKQTYEIQLFPEFGKLTVEQGKAIAYSGNTGGSSGPHLHFEIRNSVTERPQNPMEYDLPIKDSNPPEILSAFVYPIGQNASANGSFRRSQIDMYHESNYNFVADTVEALGRVGFGFVGFDRQDLAANKNGIYSVVLEVDGVPQTRQDFDQFSFGESSQINTLIDYDYLERFRRRIQKCFRDEGNNLSMFKSLKGDGTIELRSGETREVRILLTDHHGNRSQLLIPVVGKRNADPAVRETVYGGTWISRDKPYQFEWEQGGVFFPKGTFYKDVSLDVGWEGSVLRVHRDLIPTRKRFHISMKVPDSLKGISDKLYIARQNSRGNWGYTSTYLSNSVLSTKAKYLGAYKIAVDTVAPEISPVNFDDGSRLRNYSYLKVRIRDRETGIDTYNAWVNGEWILMEYESKKNLLTYNFEDGKIPKGKSDIRIAVTDQVGNRETYIGTLVLQ